MWLATVPGAPEDEIDNFFGANEVIAEGSNHVDISLEELSQPAPSDDTRLAVAVEATDVEEEAFLDSDASYAAGKNDVMSESEKSDARRRPSLFAAQETLEASYVKEAVFQSFEAYH